MYSRSYGIAENGGREHKGFNIPPDYNGTIYSRRSLETIRDTSPPTASEAPSSAEEAPALTEAAFTAEAPQRASSREMPVPAKETAAVPKAGILGGLLDKISVDDLVMFGLLMLLLTGESVSNASLLTVLLAILFI